MKNITLSLIFTFSWSFQAQSNDLFSWQKTIKLENKYVELIAVPEIARIMSFKNREGKSLIWFNKNLLGTKVEENSPKKGWTNYGGSKLWVAPQSVTKWPPDPYTDQGVCQIKKDNNTLSMLGRKSPKSNMQMNREITLLPGQPVVKLIFSMTYFGDKEKRRSLWHIVQMVPWGQGFVPLTDKEKFYWAENHQDPNQWSKFKGGWRLDFKGSTKTTKLFAYSAKSYLFYRLGTDLFIMSFKNEVNKEFPGDESPSEIFVSNQYVELEHVSPAKNMKKGDKIEMVEYWHALKVGKNDSFKDVHKFVEKYLKDFRSKNK